jgi:hypothetical protein
MELETKKRGIIELRFDLYNLAPENYRRKWIYLIKEIIPRKCVERDIILQCCINHCKLSPYMKLRVSEDGVDVVWRTNSLGFQIIKLRFIRERIVGFSSNGNSIRMEMKFESDFYDFLKEICDIKRGFSIGFGETIGEKTVVNGLIIFREESEPQRLTHPDEYKKSKDINCPKIFPFSFREENRLKSKL